MSDHLTPEQLAHFKLLASKSMGLGIGGWQSEIKNVDLAALLAHIDWQAATIQRVSDLHPREVAATHPGYGDEVYCPECWLHSPCNTQFALDGGQE